MSVRISCMLWNHGDPTVSPHLGINQYFAKKAASNVSLPWHNSKPMTSKWQHVENWENSGYHARVAELLSIKEEV